MSSAEEIKFTDNLVNARFDRLLTETELTDFYAFLNREGIPRLGFVLKYEYSGSDDILWGIYIIESVEPIGLRYNVKYAHLPDFILSKSRNVPEELEVRGYPIWVLRR